MTSELAGKTCTRCRGDIRPMQAQEAERYLRHTRLADIRFGWGYYML